MAVEYSAGQLAIIQKLRTDLKFFAAKCLKIKTDRGIESFIFNEVQEYIHWRAELQLSRTGKVRMVVVKARQQGCSEYVSARGYKYVTQNKARTVYILSHESSSTTTLFGKVDRYQRHCPAQMKPQEIASNRNQKKFNNESEYTVGTAGSENTGRSNTVQFGHLSEPAHYDNDEGIKSGLLQTISDAPGTEIWWETTANGKNWFYKFCMSVLRGETEYELCFIPWFWTWRYRIPAPADFVPTQDELDLASTGTYFDPVDKEVKTRVLDNDQLFWRRRKIASLGERLFKQEYPATLDEAFQSTGNSFIPSELVAKARKSTLVSDFGATVLGCDPGRTGDRTVIAKRRGRQIYDLDKYKQMQSMQLTGILSNKIDKEQVDKAFVDWGMGHGTIDRLHERNYRQQVEGINFGGSPNDPRFLNKRAEMIFAFRDWLMDGEVRLPDDDDMAVDIAAIPEPELTSNGLIKFPSKDDIRKDHGISPDIMDAICLTFAFPVAAVQEDAVERMKQTENTKRGSGLSTRQRILSGDNSEDADWAPSEKRKRIGR